MASNHIPEVVTINGVMCDQRCGACNVPQPMKGYKPGHKRVCKNCRRKLIVVVTQDDIGLCHSWNTVAPL